LTRYVGAAEAFDADVVVRVTSDCPLIDAEVADQVLGEFCHAEADFAYNDVERGFPRGLDVEVCSREALQKAAQIADCQYQREHVTPALYEHPDIFKVRAVHAEKDFSKHRWTLDTADDLQVIRKIYTHFCNQDDFTWRDIVRLVQRSPDLARINAHVLQKSVHEVAAS
jgi:spore coat polysaccharide biosynthesis protein SpsF